MSGTRPRSKPTASAAREGTEDRRPWTHARAAWAVPSRWRASSTPSSPAVTCASAAPSFTLPEWIPSAE
eukprot:CAMPEP_0113923208 /NCGR_PEP_ID=MMETSP1159-20121227/2025_1 /TAXON_ID=88271 /ORGANISM="Picocystis salinarum" /LENGTH=68 /DNA_ID=CAMNT_0000923371 /DNA_START=91 /DNA_END=294 /DNA_ORIENTATION=- /assembly_acc=CAM_ASM_000767